MNTQRFYPPSEWKRTKHNANFIGLIRLINELSIFVEGGNIEVNFSEEPTMIEIGSYMGESTMMFASSGIFKKIYTHIFHAYLQIYDFLWFIIIKIFFWIDDNTAVFPRQIQRFFLLTSSFIVLLRFCTIIII